mmetsp:Transcript_39276/g.116380  ORF Transcript_39276/g.116380 Transcript_39276/m.116380 type:complete len:221 (-) Transcript_39276:145-807(-)
MSPASLKSASASLAHCSPSELAGSTDSIAVASNSDAEASPLLLPVLRQILSISVPSSIAAVGLALAKWTCARMCFAPAASGSRSSASLATFSAMSLLPVPRCICPIIPSTSTSPFWSPASLYMDRALASTDIASWESSCFARWIWARKHMALAFLLLSSGTPTAWSATCRASSNSFLARCTSMRTLSPSTSPSLSPFARQCVRCSCTSLWASAACPSPNV